MKQKCLVVIDVYGSMRSVNLEMNDKLETDRQLEGISLSSDVLLGSWVTNECLKRRAVLSNPRPGGRMRSAD